MRLIESSACCGKAHLSKYILRFVLYTCDKPPTQAPDQKGVAAVEVAKQSMYRRPVCGLSVLDLWMMQLLSGLPNYCNMKDKGRSN